MNKNPLFYKWSNLQLHDKLSDCTKYERKLQGQIISLIQEIFVRRIFLDKCYSSMLEYLVKEMSYPESTALRRIASAKIIAMAPEAKEALQNGEINQGQLQKLNMALGKMEASPEEKTKIVQNILPLLRNVNGRQTDQVLAQELNFQAKPQNKTQFNADGTVTITLTLSKDQFENLENAKSSLSHAVPNGDLVEVIDHMSKIQLKKRPVQSCQFKDAETGKVCASHHQVEVDHILAKWMGGGDKPENLQWLCDQHNRHKYRKEAKIRAG